MIAAAVIAAGTWPQQVRRRPTLLCIRCATTESDWLVLWFTDQQVRDLVIEFFCSANRSAKDGAIGKSKLPAKIEYGCSD